MHIFSAVTVSFSSLAGGPGHPWVFESWCHCCHIPRSLSGLIPVAHSQISLGACILLVGVWGTLCPPWHAEPHSHTPCSAVPTLPLGFCSAFGAWLPRQNGRGSDATDAPRASPGPSAPSTLSTSAGRRCSGLPKPTPFLLQAISHGGDPLGEA